MMEPPLQGLNGFLAAMVYIQRLSAITVPF